MKLDFHGYTIHTAWKEFNAAIDEAYYANQRSVVVVTGQGQMMREFENWCRNNPKIREVTQHKHNPGSWSVKLRKKKNA